MIIVVFALLIRFVLNVCQDIFSIILAPYNHHFVYLVLNYAHNAQIYQHVQFAQIVFIWKMEVAIYAKYKIVIHAQIKQHALVAMTKLSCCLILRNALYAKITFSTVWIAIIIVLHSKLNAKIVWILSILQVLLIILSAQYIA
jgi:hypothetical protein